MVFILIAAFLFVVFLEAPYLFRRKMWKELIVFFSILTISAVYSLGQLYEWTLPNPTQGVKIIFEPVSIFVDNLLK
jgi:hypothetical protein